MFWDADKREAKALKALCAKGKHELSEAEYMYRYIICTRTGCNYSFDNPNFDEVRTEKERKKRLREQEIKKGIAKAQCKLRGHVYGETPIHPDWMVWCNRCDKQLI